MRHRPPFVRLVAAVLAALLGLTGPGAVLGHGVAHEREHRLAASAEHHGADDHHAIRSVDAVVHGHEHDHGEGHGAAVIVADEAQDGATPSRHAPLSRDGLVVRPRTEGAAHGHPRLDALAISRLVTGALLPALPTLVPAAPVILATMAPPPAASPLRLAEPPTGPPPPSRAPPLG